MTDFPDIKLKTLVTFPGNIIGGVGVTTTRANGHVTVDMDWSEFGTQSTAPTSETNNVLTYDTETDSYVMIPSQLLAGATGIEEAPMTGLQYGRQMGDWTTIAGSSVVSWFVDPRDHGAVIDGSTDDTTAWQAAINAAISSGKPLMVPPGTSITRKLTYNGDLVMFGLGENCVLKMKNSTSLTSSEGILTAAAANTTLDIKNFTLHGNRANQIARCLNTLVVSDGFANNIILADNVNFLEVTLAGIAFYGDLSDPTTERLRITNCSFVGINEGTPYVAGPPVDLGYDPKFITIIDGAWATIESNYFNAANSFPAGFGASGVIVQATNTDDGPIFTRLIVSNCTFRGLGRMPAAGNALGVLDFYIWSNGVHISNNLFEGSVSHVIRGKCDSLNIAITGNTVNTAYNVSDGINVTGVPSYGQPYGQLIIANNNVYNTGSRGIVVDGSSDNMADYMTDVIVSNNTVVSAAANAIQVGHCSTGTISGNSCSFNTGYAIRLNDCVGAWAITGNTINNSTSIGIGVTGTGLAGLRATINDNSIISPGGQGIYVQSCDTVVVSGNSITAVSGASRGVDIVSATSAMVKNNVTSSTTTPFLKGTMTRLFEHGNSWNGETDYGSTIPTGGAVGDVRWNTAPTVSAGWINTASGWRDFASVGLRTQLRCTTNLSKANATPAAPAGMAFTAIAGKKYAFCGVLEIAASAAGGWQVEFEGTATATALLAYIEGVNTTTGAAVKAGRVTALASAVGENTSTATSVRVVFDGVIEVNAGGTFGPQFAQNVTNAAASTCLENSWVAYWEVL